METALLPQWFWLTGLFLFGLVFGSFGNVVIWRLPRGESLVTPGSHCPSCDAAIAWYDNIPVISWVMLRGRCRTCDAAISLRYPVVEVTSGVLWLAAGIKFGLSLMTIAAAVMFYLLLLLAFIDLDTMRLPNALVGLLAAIGAAGAAFSQFSHVAFVPLTGDSNGLLGQPLVASVVGALVASVPVLVLGLAYAAIRKTQGYGIGDMKLLAAVGIYLGPYSLVGLFIAVLLGAVYGVLSAMSSGEGGRHKFPFGPFVAAGAVLAALFGPWLWGAYLGLIHLAA